MWGPTEFISTGVLRDYNGSAELASIDVPTLLTCGEFDEATPDTTRRGLDVMSGIVPGESRRVAAALPNAAKGDQPREEGEPQLTILPPSFEALRGGDTGRRGRGVPKRVAYDLRRGSGELPLRRARVRRGGQWGPARLSEGSSDVLASFWSRSY